MPNLKDQIQGLAADFAASVVKAFHGASFADIAALTTAPSSGSSSPKSAPKAKRKRGRPATKPAPAVKALPAAPKPATPAPAKKAAGGKAPKMRRGPEEIAKIIGRIADLVSKSDKGMNAEGIGKALGLKPNEMRRPLDEGLAAKKLTKKGVKRATVYFAAKK